MNKLISAFIQCQRICPSILRSHDTSPPHHLLCFSFPSCFSFFLSSCSWFIFFHYNLSSPTLFSPSSLSCPLYEHLFSSFSPSLPSTSVPQKLHKHSEFPDSPANSAFIYYQANCHWLKWKHYNLQGSPDSFMFQNQTVDSAHSCCGW